MFDIIFFFANSGLSDIATHITNIKCKSFKAVKRYMNIYGQGAHK